MPNDWNTVNVKPGPGGVLREIDKLRRQYADHRSTLERLAMDAPTEHLAMRYRDLVNELDASMARIADLEMGVTPGAQQDPLHYDATPDSTAAEAFRPPTAGGAHKRTLLIVLVGLFMVAVLALLAWNWLQDESPASSPPEEVAETTESVEPLVEEAGPDLTVTPEAHHYGTIRRGARAARQFEITNNTELTLPIQIRRSECRCLWFEYADTIPPNGTTTLTVTIDAAKAPAGPLRETVQVLSASEPQMTTEFDLTATIQ